MTDFTSVLRKSQSRVLVASVSKNDKNRKFREMDNNYKKGLFPYCPNCNKKIDPLKIISWGIGH